MDHRVVSSYSAVLAACLIRDAPQVQARFTSCVIFSFDAGLCTDSLSRMFVPLISRLFSSSFLKSLSFAVLLQAGQLQALIETIDDFAVMQHQANLLSGDSLQSMVSCSTALRRVAHGLPSGHEAAVADSEVLHRSLASIVGAQVDDDDDDDDEDDETLREAVSQRVDADAVGPRSSTTLAPSVSAQSDRTDEAVKQRREKAQVEESRLWDPFAVAAAPKKSKLIFSDQSSPLAKRTKQQEMCQSSVEASRGSDASPPGSEDSVASAFEYDAPQPAWLAASASASMAGSAATHDGVVRQYGKRR
jgi:hypothetical protein